MITLEIIREDEPLLEVGIPQTWDEVTVEVFSRIFKTNTEDMLEVEKAIYYASALTGLSQDDLYDLTPEQFKLISDEIGFLSTTIGKDEVDSIMVGDNEYFIHSNFKSYTFGEIVTTELILEKGGGNPFTCMDKLLCVLLRKKKSNGKLEKFKSEFMERYDEFKMIPITQVYSIFTFFSNSKGV